MADPIQVDGEGRAHLGYFGRISDGRLTIDFPAGDSAGVGIDVAANADGRAGCKLGDFNVNQGIAAPVDAVAASKTVSASGTPADGNTVTVNGQAYTFKTALTPADYEVLIDGQDNSMTNLEHAINGTGGTPGTDYQVPGAHPDVTAGDVATHAITLTAIVKGTSGNAITLAKSGANLSVGGAVLAGGVDGSTGSKGEFRYFDGNLYLCTADAGISVSGAWKKVTLGSV